MGRRWLLCIVLTAAVSIATGCGGRRGGDDVAVPRRPGYYRLNLPDATYRSDTIGAVELQLNAATESTRDGHGWLTVIYPSKTAELYITLTDISGADGETAVANRIERLSMNTGGARTEIIEMEGRDAGRHLTLMVTPAGSPTPVQFLAIEPGRWMLSGSAMVSDFTQAPVDSLRPVVEMLRRDVTYLLENL